MDRITNMEHLMMDTTPRGAVVKYGQQVFVTDIHWRGHYTAKIYEFVETPEETELGDIECRLSLINEAEERFKDNGHALEWCLKQI